MKDELITFDTAKLAKEKGFSNKEYYYYHTDGSIDSVNETHSLTPSYKENWNIVKDRTTAPTQSLLQRWLREEHNLYIDIHSGHYAWNNKVSFFKSVKSIFKHSDKHYSYREKEVSTYEEALEKGLQEALKLIK